MRNVVLLILITTYAFGVNAQTTKVITGTVIDKNGNPLSNALVEATGGAESVITGADGSFRLEVPATLKSLTAKYTGMQDRRIKLRSDSQMMFEMKPKTSGAWFLNAVFAVSFNFVGDEFGRAGLMCGYLGNWGGYGKFLLPFAGGTETIPSGTIGVIKQVVEPLYFYLGAGYTPVFYCLLDSYYDSGSVVGKSRTLYNNGAMFDIGAIINFGQFNVGLGYNFGSDFGSYNNHSIQTSVGYCF